MLPKFIAETEGNSAAKSRDHLVPHAEEEGASAPNSGILVSLQEGPQDLMHGYQGTLHDSHVPWKMRCKTMKIQEEDIGETQHHVMRRAHLYPFLEVITPRKVIELHSGSMDMIVHPCL